jgi:hypothetical protein
LPLPEAALPAPLLTMAPSTQIACPLGMLISLLETLKLGKARIQGRDIIVLRAVADRFALAEGISPQSLCQ